MSGAMKAAKQIPAMDTAIIEATVASKSKSLVIALPPVLLYSFEYRQRGAL
jgi:hypothetical protein